MANPFLTDKSHDEIETAIIYEKALIHDIGNAVAFTDGDRVFVNTPDNLATILPDYNDGMLKWILWHERYHMELKHHNRFFKYLKELSETDTIDEFHVTKDEVNIIMDILVHDSLSKMFPELVETALNNLAQMRNRNSLGYTFKTYTLEEMLTEYAEYKKSKETDGGKGEGEGKETEETTEDSKGEGEGKGKEDSKDETEKGKDEKKGKDSDSGKKESKKGHSEGGKTPPTKDDKSHAEDGEPEVKDAERPAEEPSEHDKTDWSKLEKIDSKEFIEKSEADRYEEEINALRRKKLKIGRLTHKLNGLATTKRERTYRLPSMLQTNDGCIFKGKTAGKVELYLIFDASGSMAGEMETFKEIISHSIPQAMNCPCEWFAGYNSPITPYKTEHCDGYYKAKFKDFMEVRASSGYDDDGDRVIELCYLAEQMGFSPIGVTDGGGCLSWSKDKLKKLRRTILVGQNGHWLSKVKEVNPHIQTLEISM